METTSEILNTELDGLYYKIVPCEGATQVAVIFATVSVAAGRFSFYKNMEKQQVHRIYVNDPANGWYQSGIPGLGTSVDETIETLKKWKERLGAEEIVTIGSSMGGYGAILYGAKLGCRVLTFGAETVLQMPNSRSYKNMPKGSPIVYKDLRPLIASSEAHITLFTGEADVTDLVAARHIYGLDNVEIITIRGIAHGAPVFLDEKFGVSNIFKWFLDETPFPVFFERGDLCEIGHAVDLLYQANEHIVSRKWDSAKETLTELLCICPLSDVAHHKIGIALFHLGDTEKAAKHQAKAVEISPHFANAHHHLGIALRKIGKLEEALEAHKKACEIEPKLAGAHHHAGITLEMLKRFNEAEDAYRLAVSLDKKNVNYVKKLAEFLRQNAVRKLEESSNLLLSLLPK